MAWVSVAGAAVGASPAIFKAFKGIGQTNQANGMKLINPGYQINNSVINNAKTLSDQYGNYQLPGYSQMAGNINSTFQNAFDSGKQGATTGSDILDLATRMAYGKNRAFNELDTENAQGKQSMLGAYLNANAAAGQEYQNKNAYDRDVYNGQVKEKAALTQAGAANTYGAFDQIAGTASKYLFSMKKDGTDATGNPADPTAGGNTNASYNKYFYPNGSPRFDRYGNPIPSVQDSNVPATSIY